MSSVGFIKSFSFLLKKLKTKKIQARNAVIWNWVWNTKRKSSKSRTPTVARFKLSRTNNLLRNIRWAPEMIKIWNIPIFLNSLEMFWSVFFIPQTICLYWCVYGLWGVAHWQSFWAFWLQGSSCIKRGFARKPSPKIRMRRMSIVNDNAILTRTLNWQKKWAAKSCPVRIFRFWKILGVKYKILLITMV